MNEVERANILSWDERINMLSVNPHAATIDDIAIMAAELSERRASALLGEAATTKEAASYIEAAEDLRAWLHEHIDVPDEIYIPFIASIERAATLRQQFMRSLPPIWDDDAKRAIDSFVNMYLAELNKQMNHSAKGSQSK